MDKSNFYKHIMLFNQGYRSSQQENNNKAQKKEPFWTVLHLVAYCHLYYHRLQEYHHKVQPLFVSWEQETGAEMSHLL